MTEPTDLRDRVEQLLVEFDGVESKRLAADEIMNRVVGPELDRLRERGDVLSEMLRAMARRTAVARVAHDDLAVGYKGLLETLDRFEAERDEAHAELDRLRKALTNSPEVNGTLFKLGVEREVERDQARRERDLALWLHAEAKWELAAERETIGLMGRDIDRLDAVTRERDEARAELADVRKQADGYCRQWLAARDTAGRLRSALAGAVVLPKNWRKQVADIHVVELVQSWQDKQSECPSCGEPLRLVDHADDCPAVPAEDTPEPRWEPKPGGNHGPTMDDLLAARAASGVSGDATGEEPAKPAATASTSKMVELLEDIADMVVCFDKDQAEPLYPRVFNLHQMAAFCASVAPEPTAEAEPAEVDHHLIASSRRPAGSSRSGTHAACTCGAQLGIVSNEPMSSKYGKAAARQAHERHVVAIGSLTEAPAGSSVSEEA